ncbi:MAG TPA: acyltransferase family protein [Ilumatobacter sp.]|nr:acyltransferase family protein [Ilumatobacter sp.]
MSGTPTAATARIANLDGLRAISIAFVFLFHAQVPGFGGGFLGVSLFFTLSGYLLGLRLADRPLVRPTIQRYWVGRVRRLVPLAWVVVAGVVAVEVATNSSVADAPRRLWMTVIGASNWNQLWSDASYASLFATPDALVHFWSLAVEQQVYLLLPIVLLAVWRLGTYQRRIAAIVGLAVVSWTLPFVTGWSVARTYYGTDTRAGEILIGVALALTHLWHRQTVRRTHDLPTGRANLMAGVAMLTMLSFVVFATPAGDAIRRGLLPAQAIVSVALVHVAVRCAGLWRGVLERRPVVYIGTLSYAIYLVHWPFLIVAERQGWPRPMLVVVVAVGSVASSALLVRLVETPFRSGNNDRALLGALAATLLILPAAAAIVPTSTTSAYLSQLERDGAALDFDATDDESSTSTATSPPPDDDGDVASTVSTDSTDVPSTSRVDAEPATRADTVATTVPTSSPASTTPAMPSAGNTRVGVFGDSIALSIALVLADAPVAGTELVATATMLGCSILPVEPDERCADAMTEWDATTASTPIDLALAMSCQWELIEREVPGGGPSIVGDPVFDEALASAVRTSVQRLLDGGVAQVGWMNCPAFAQTVGWPPEPALQDSRNVFRVIRWNEIISSVIAEFGDRAVVVPVAEWMVPHTEDVVVRPDGSHFAYEEPTAFTEALGDILRPAIDRAAAGGT